MLNASVTSLEKLSNVKLTFGTSISHVMLRASFYLQNSKHMMEHIDHLVYHVSHDNDINKAFRMNNADLKKFMIY